MRCWPAVSTNSSDVTAEPNRVLVVVPAFNEEACIADVVTRVHATGHDCLVVNDGSSDNTAQHAATAGAVVVSLPINLGVGGALRAGFRYAIAHGYRVVVQVDADGQHPPEAIGTLVDALRTQPLDMVVGSRFASGGTFPMSPIRKAAVRMLSAGIARANGTRLTDPTSGFRAIRSPLLDAFAEEFPHHYLGDTFEALLVADRRGYRIGEVPVAMHARQGGQPSANGYASFQAMLRACSVWLTGTTFDLAPRPPTDGPASC